MTDVLKRLTEVLRDRARADPQSSYVAGLFDSGLNRILEKVGEEAIETILAAKDAAAAPGDAANDALIHEIADLWFHTLVLLVHLNQDPQAVLTELERRFGTSGLDEKSGRTKR